MNSNIFSSTLKKLLPAFFLAVAFLVYFAYLLQAIYVERALYADGANFFIELLTKDSSWPVADDANHIRLFINILNQLPVVFALDFGVTSLRTLKLCFGAGLFLTPLFLYLYCLYLSQRANDYRVLFFSIVSLITCAIPSDIFILNQALTSLSLAWVLAHYLLLTLKIKWIDWIIVSVVSLLLFRSHEGMILWGMSFFIGSICVLFFRDRFSISNKNLIVCAIGVIGFLEAAFVLLWLSSHPLKDQTSAYLQLFYLLNPSQLWTGNTRISLLMVIAVFCLFATQVRSKHKISEPILVKIIVNAILIFVLFLMVLSGFSALIDFSLADPWSQFSYRFLITFGATGWMLASIAFIVANKPVNKNIRSLSTVVVSVGIISASLWQISNNIQWSIFANTASQVLQSASTPIVSPKDVRERLATLGHENAYKYSWSWAWPVFGMSLQQSGEVEKLFKPDGYEQYFNPPKSIPFIPMSGGDIGSEGNGLFRFDRFVKLQ
jgi:hypothetical protein